MSTIDVYNFGTLLWKSQARYYVWTSDIQLLLKSFESEHARVIAMIHHLVHCSLENGDILEKVKCPLV
jgi:hypothetical protein